MNSESYSPFTLSIFGVDHEESEKKDQAWQWECNDQTFTPAGFFNHAMFNTQQINNLQFVSFPDCNPPPPLPSLPALPMDQYAQQQPPPAQPLMATEYYHAGFVKPVEERIGYGGNGALDIGLNLNNSTYFPSAERVSFNRLLWRSRGGYFFAHQPPRCQAEGCKADLSNAKRYHRRHKVCEFHSKESIVIVSGGLQQRFCQQCSRFHTLDAFDDAKKSCRKRLADHNRRRRKPQSSDNGSQAPITSKKKPPASKSMNQASKSTHCGTSTRNVSALNSKDLDWWNNQSSQATILRIGSSLSLGGAGTNNPRISTQHRFNYQEALDAFSEESSEHQLQQQLSSASYSNIHNLQHQNLSYYSASKGVVAHCAGGINPDLIHQQQSSLLQIRQAMFELDYV